MDVAVTDSAYSLREGFALVHGACRSALHSFRSGRVFHLNASESKALADGMAGNLSAETRTCCERFVSLGILRRGPDPADSPALPDTAPPPRLRYVWLELTARCNCRCIHCYGAFGGPEADSAASELAEAEWLDALRQIRRLGCNAVQLIGGEPLLSPAFGSVLREADALGFGTVDVFTNGTLATPSVANELKRHRASVRLSVYGFDAASHAAITGNPRSFELMDRGIDVLLETGVPIRPTVILMRENQHLLPEIRAYLLRKGLPYGGFDTVRTANPSRRVTDPDLLAQRFVSPGRFRTSQRTFAVNRHWNSCWYGKFALAANGDVLPCIFARDQICGNIRSTPHAVIRERLLQLWSLTKDAVETCAQCEFRHACDDCRPLALAENGSLLSKYPRCTYDPSTGHWKSFASSQRPPDGGVSGHK